MGQIVLLCLGHRARRGMAEHGPARADPGGAVLVDDDERRDRGRGRHAGGARILLGGAAAGAVTTDNGLVPNNLSA